MKINPHRTPEKVFHEKVIAKAKELFRTETLVLTTFVSCINPKCTKLLSAFVSAQYPILKVKCPYCGKENHRRILSDAFINHNLFNLAKDYVLHEMHVLEESILKDNITPQEDTVLTIDNLQEAADKIKEIGHIPKIQVLPQSRADAFGVEAIQFANGDILISEDVARDFSETK